MPETTVHKLFFQKRRGSATASQLSTQQKTEFRLCFFQVGKGKIFYLKNESLSVVFAMDCQDHKQSLKVPPHPSVPISQFFKKSKRNHRTVRINVFLLFLLDDRRIRIRIRIFDSWIRIWIRNIYATFLQRWALPIEFWFSDIYRTK
jgi:hypothetical protein